MLTQLKHGKFEAAGIDNAALSSSGPRLSNGTRFDEAASPDSTKSSSSPPIITVESSPATSGSAERMASSVPSLSGEPLPKSTTNNVGHTVPKVKAAMEDSNGEFTALGPEMTIPRGRGSINEEIPAMQPESFLYSVVKVSHPNGLKFVRTMGTPPPARQLFT